MIMTIEWMEIKQRDGFYLQHETADSFLNHMKSMQTETPLTWLLHRFSLFFCNIHRSGGRMFSHIDGIEWTEPHESMLPSEPNHKHLPDE